MDPPQSSLTRRNGRLQSCESCRKLKVGCDHSIPDCGRCLHKQIPCVYHPAPLTTTFRKARVGADANGGPRGKARMSRTRPFAVPALKGTWQRQQHQQKHGSSAAGTSPSQDSAISVQTPLDTSGFLGPTSYNAGMSTGQLFQCTTGDSTTRDNQYTMRTIEPRDIHSGSQILLFLNKHQISLRNLVLRFYEISQITIMPDSLMKAALLALWDILTDCPMQGGSPQLTEVVVHVFENSYKALVVTKLTTFEEYCCLITGASVRWETIANMLILAAIALLHLPDRDLDQLAINTSKPDLLSKLYEVIDSCLTLCNALPFMNELVVCLKYNQMVLTSLRHGDSSRWLCSCLGDLSSCIYATGCHQAETTTTELPYFIGQLRRRCFAVVYSMDKSISTFLGRPPLINRQYCLLDPPIDLSDEHVNLHGQSPQNVQISVNPDGWNSDGKRNSVSLIRIRFLLASVREETMELCLGVDRDDLQQRSQRLLQRARSIWNNCPDYLRYHSNIWSEQLPYREIWPLFSVFLDYLYSIFLLHRIVAQNCRDKCSELLQCAHDILSTLLVINQERDRLMDIKSDFSWIFLSYGLPSADALTVALLQQSPSDPWRASLPRAEIIRKLTVYISCLSWAAKPGRGNFEICKNIQTRLTQALDQVIDPRALTLGDADIMLTINPELVEPTFSSLGVISDWDGINNWDLCWDLFDTSTL